MGIKAISSADFDKRLPNNLALQLLLGEEVEWFSNRSGKLLGTIAKSEGVAGYSYAILKRDRKGTPHIRKVMNNFFSVNAARVDLLLSMADMETIIELSSLPSELFALNDEPNHLIPPTAAHCPAGGG